MEKQRTVDADRWRQIYFAVYLESRKSGCVGMCVTVVFNLNLCDPVAVVSDVSQLCRLMGQWFMNYVFAYADSPLNFALGWPPPTRREKNMPKIKV
jgi:hypothetical protein